MFLACDGLISLVNYLDPNYDDNKELVHIAIDCVHSIFKIHEKVIEISEEMK